MLFVTVLAALITVSYASLGVNLPPQEVFQDPTVPLHSGGNHSSCDGFSCSNHITNMPVIEYVEFLASDPYIQDQSVAKPLFDLASKEDGFVTVYYGLRHEDNKTGVFGVVWESYEKHKKFMDSPNYYNALELVALLLSPAQEFSMHHVLINVDPTVAFTAPITEVIHLEPKDGEAEGGPQRLHEASQLLDTINGIQQPPTWGEIRETPGAYYIFVGWESLEAHLSAFDSEDGKLNQIVTSVKQVFDSKVAHVQFAKYV